jgi:hypothetical protein
MLHDFPQLNDSHDKSKGQRKWIRSGPHSGSKNLYEISQDEQVLVEDSEESRAPTDVESPKLSPSANNAKDDLAMTHLLSYKIMV